MSNDAKKVKRDQVEAAIAKEIAQSIKCGFTGIQPACMALYDALTLAAPTPAEAPSAGGEIVDGFDRGFFEGTVAAAKVVEYHINNSSMLPIIRALAPPQHKRPSPSAEKVGWDEPSEEELFELIHVHPKCDISFSKMTDILKLRADQVARGRVKA